MNSDPEDKLHKIIEEKEKEIARLKSSLVTDNHEFNSKLQEVKDFYEEILALVPGHIYWLDRNNVFLGCNDAQAKNAGLSSRKEIVGKTNYDLPWKDQADELNRVNNNVMETGVANITEEYAVMADGTTIYLSNKIPLRNKAQEIVGVLGLSVDITDRKKMEVALRRAKEHAELISQAKTEFIANINQDIRVPLDGIVAMSQHIQTRTENKELQQYAHWISQSGANLLHLLNASFENLTDYTAQSSEIQLQSFKLRGSIHNIIELMYPSLQLNNIEFSIAVNEAVPEHFITDGIKLHRILLNLFTILLPQTETNRISIKIDLVAQDSAYAQLQFAVSNSQLEESIKTESTADDAADEQLEDEILNQNTTLSIAHKYVGLLGGELKSKSDPEAGRTLYFTLSLKTLRQGMGTTPS